MKTVQLKQFGIDNLVIAEVPAPVPAKNEVLIKMEAASLNFLEAAIVSGTYFHKPALPFTPSSEGAGIVAAVGENVTQWKAGDRVTTHYIQNWIGGPNRPETNTVKTGNTTPGVLSEYIVMPEHALLRTPSNLSSVEAATLPVAGVTAWTGLINYANIQPGQYVLTQGSGGVSLFALQIALAAGAKVIATTSSEEKAAKLKQLGAHEVVNYKTNPDWSTEVKRLSEGLGVHATIDISGSDTINNSLKSLRYNGFVGTVGFMSGAQLPIELFNMLGYARIQGYSVGSRDSFQQLINAIETNHIKPVIDSVYTLDTVQDAFRQLASGKGFGKIVVAIN
ncbi:zinc-dependent alcohol dehydrogenase family protein [Chitinophaga vietnamensis]|uniref:zinc-dependent alcohol dehydrogenase family protein n=1 Tax=Chitinophaga vietnamensis TaxID=2593957 RepID=UPI0011776AB0|nr:NAD(P)-dependent alcohol dehydrogenase [Chitinophaga vietnamensis]